MNCIFSKNKSLSTSNLSASSTHFLLPKWTKKVWFGSKDIELICMWQILALDPEMFPKAVAFFHSFLLFLFFDKALAIMLQITPSSVLLLNLKLKEQSHQKSFTSIQIVWELFCWKWHHSIVLLKCFVRRFRWVLGSPVTFWSPV